MWLELSSNCFDVILTIFGCFDVVLTIFGCFQLIMNQFRLHLYYSGRSATTRTTTANLFQPSPNLLSLLSNTTCSPPSLCFCQYQNYYASLLHCSCPHQTNSLYREPPLMIILTSFPLSRIWLCCKIMKMVKVDVLVRLGDLVVSAMFAAALWCWLGWGY